MIVDDGNDLVALLVFVPRVPNPLTPLFGHGVGPVAMPHTEVKVLRCRQMPRTGDACLPQRSISGPCREDSVHGRVVGLSTCDESTSLTRGRRGAMPRLPTGQLQRRAHRQRQTHAGPARSRGPDQDDRPAADRAAHARPAVWLYRLRTAVVAAARRTTLCGGDGAARWPGLRAGHTVAYASAAGVKGR
jgi:hypothetical protein